MNIGTFVVLIIVLAIVAFAIRYLVNAKKSGKTCSGCSGSCSGCGGSCKVSNMVDSLQNTSKNKDN